MGAMAATATDADTAMEATATDADTVTDTTVESAAPMLRLSQLPLPRPMLSPDTDTTAATDTVTVTATDTTVKKLNHIIIILKPYSSETEKPSHVKTIGCASFMPIAKKSRH